MHLAFVTRLREVVVVLGLQGRAGQAEKQMRICSKREKNQAMGSLHRTISSSVRYSFPPSERAMMLCL